MKNDSGTSKIPPSSRFSTRILADAQQKIETKKQNKNEKSTVIDQITGQIDIYNTIYQDLQNQRKNKIKLNTEIQNLTKRFLILHCKHASLSDITPRSLRPVTNTVHDTVHDIVSRQPSRSVKLKTQVSQLETQVSQLSRKPKRISSKSVKRRKTTGSNTTGKVFRINSTLSGITENPSRVLENSRGVQVSPSAVQVSPSAVQVNLNNTNLGGGGKSKKHIKKVKVPSKVKDCVNLYLTEGTHENSQLRTLLSNIKDTDIDAHIKAGQTIIKDHKEQINNLKKQIKKTPTITLQHDLKKANDEVKKYIHDYKKDYYLLKINNKFDKLSAIPVINSDNIKKYKNIVSYLVVLRAFTRKSNLFLDSLVKKLEDVGNKNNLLDHTYVNDDDNMRLLNSHFRKHNSKLAKSTLDSFFKKKKSTKKRSGRKSHHKSSGKSHHKSSGKSHGKRRRGGDPEA
jgi:hypothetical protein